MSPNLRGLGPGGFSKGEKYKGKVFKIIIISVYYYIFVMMTERRLIPVLKNRKAAAMKPTITARGKVERMGPKQFNVLVEEVDRYLAEFKEAGCGIRADWAGKKPLLVTISREGDQGGEGGALRSLRR
jgi:hypothetical protein